VDRVRDASRHRVGLARKGGLFIDSNGLQISEIRHRRRPDADLGAYGDVRSRSGDRAGRGFGRHRARNRADEVGVEIDGMTRIGFMPSILGANGFQPEYGRPGKVWFVPLYLHNFDQSSHRSPALADVHWIMPTLAIDVGIASWTSNEPMRRASFKGLREDKSTESIVLETPAALPSR
jgi:hypothetical protein